VIEGVPAFTSRGRVIEGVPAFTSRGRVIEGVPAFTSRGRDRKSPSVHIEGEIEETPPSPVKGEGDIRAPQELLPPPCGEG